MKIVFYSVSLNHHQAPVADELYKLYGPRYCFVELKNLGEGKGSMEDYSKRPYLLRAWESPHNLAIAMEYALTSECCVFAGTEALVYEKERMKRGLLSFDMGERWLKRGVISLLSPRLLKWLMAYWIGGWRNKPIYKLCCSAFCAHDHSRMHTFKNKCYKWGYFTAIDESATVFEHNVLQIMWCSRLINLKHPELPLLLADNLKKNGYIFHLDVYGTGELEESARNLADSLALNDVVTFHGTIRNELVRQAMREHDIFLFTSDRNEGWGAVANESLSEGCVLVSSDAIGSSYYLIDEGRNGFTFRSSKASCGMKNPDFKALSSLCRRVVWLFEHPIEMRRMQHHAMEAMRKVWSPQCAALSLVKLIDDLHSGKESLIIDGPCSRA